MRTGVIAVVLLLMNLKLSASENNLQIRWKILPDTSVHTQEIVNDSSSVCAEFHLTENKRVVAAILAFPPFGCLGLHRIYLGTDPWVPVVYTLTLGGCGIIALVDFYEICTSDQPTFDSYSHNANVFMWEK